ncbi:hypothetical protein GCM10028818_52940 [Spirosoma horti]
MLLILTIWDSDNQHRLFSGWFTDLAVACDVASLVVLEGGQLIKVELIDNHQRTSLPVAAFDGTFFSRPLRQLEYQWQQLLA